MGVGRAGADERLPIADGGGGRGLVEGPRVDSGATSIADPKDGGLDELRKALGEGLPGGRGRGQNFKEESGGPEGDLRTLAIRYGRGSDRYREFRDATERCDPAPCADWLVRGPRTTAWVLRFLVGNGGTPMARHARFKAETGATTSDPEISSHESLCKILQTALK